MTSLRDLHRSGFALLTVLRFAHVGGVILLPVIAELDTRMSPFNEVPHRRWPTIEMRRLAAGLNWAPLVVLLAFTCTVTWTLMWLWMAVRVVRAVLS